VHRMLGFEPAGGRFAHHAEQPLEADLVVVDEISMLDLVLAHHLLAAIRPPTRLVLVGDPDQLPSVGAGNVLADLLRSRRIPTFRLTHIYRQAGTSLIVENAHRILAGRAPRFPAAGATDADFYLFPVDGEQATADRLVEVVTRRIPERFRVHWVDDVQVLSPMYRGPCGVDALNDRLREALPGDRGTTTVRGREWKLGERVIHTRNDYERDVFNGDMGRIEAISGSTGSITVRFPDRSLVYTEQELSDLQPAVVMPMVMQHWMMLRRHLVYTAVTRARKLLVLVGSMRALETAIANADEATRESGLVEKLERALVAR
jgi:exodeoxyribonuclease V alpha subunit